MTDLFDSFHSAIQFLLDLEWDDHQQMAMFATRLAKVSASHDCCSPHQIISLSVDDYCSRLEHLFTEEMQQSETQVSSAKQKAWYEKAKSTIAHLQGDRKLQAFFNFTPAVSPSLDRT